MAKSSQWNTEQKRKIVAEYDQAPHGTKGLVLRKHGLHARQIADWRDSRDAGLLEVGASMRRPITIRKENNAEIERLRHENERLQTELDRAKQDVKDRQDAIESLGKATALLHELVSGKSATPPNETLSP